VHDGRFTSLEEVIDFFDSGIQPNADLDPRLRSPDGSPQRLGLSADQKAALVAFLRTLTDTAFLTAPRFANPFSGSTTPPPLPPPPPPPSSPPPTTPPPPPPSAATVTIQATAYHPNVLTVARGAVVTWTNLDNARHSAKFASSLVGATPIFTSGSQRLTMPTTPGTYRTSAQFTAPRCAAPSSCRDGRGNLECPDWRFLRRWHASRLTRSRRRAAVRSRAAVHRAAARAEI
jgi:hypothetical protein